MSESTSFSKSLEHEAVVVVEVLVRVLLVVVDVLVLLLLVVVFNVLILTSTLVTTTFSNVSDSALRFSSNEEANCGARKASATESSS